MQLANCLVALGGDKGNAVPKQGVTPSEVAVLNAIHGLNAVHDIEVLDETVDRTPAEEKARLLEAYNARSDDDVPVVEVEFPGRRPEMFDTFEQLNLADADYRATGRATPKAAKKAGKKPAKDDAPAEAETQNVMD